MAKTKFGIIIFVLFVFSLFSTSAFALSSHPSNDSKNENSEVSSFSDSHGIEYDVVKLLEWREKIQGMIDGIKISDVGETVMDSLEECVAAINVRLGILELSRKNIRD